MKMPDKQISGRDWKNQRPKIIIKVKMLLHTSTKYGLLRKRSITVSYFFGKKLTSNGETIKTRLRDLMKEFLQIHKKNKQFMRKWA